MVLDPMLRFGYTLQDEAQRQPDASPAIHIVSRHRDGTKARPPAQSDDSAADARQWLLARHRLPQASQEGGAPADPARAAEAEDFEFSSLIKPSGNWNFFNVFYDRIDDDGAAHGYIPGDLYCNCLWYFTKAGDLVVAPMAGSGQIRRVYDDRALWMRPDP